MWMERRLIPLVFTADAWARTRHLPGGAEGGKAAFATDVSDWRFAVVGCYRRGAGAPPHDRSALAGGFSAADLEQAGCIAIFQISKTWAAHDTILLRAVAPVGAHGSP